jgi:hypothetical protein
MSGEWLAMGAVAALAAASSARGSRSHRPSDIRAVKQAHDKRVLELKAWLDERHGDVPPQARKAIWDSNVRLLRRRFRTELESAWQLRLDEAARWVDSGDARQGGAWRDRVLAQPYAYHFTAYDRLPSIRQHGLVGGVTEDSRVMRDKPCVFLTTAGGGRMWAKYATDKRIREFADRDNLLWNQTFERPASRMRAAPIVLRIRTHRLSPHKLRLDRVGTIDGLYKTEPRDDIDPANLFAFCSLTGLRAEDLEWARVTDDAQVQGPWMPVARGSKNGVDSWQQLAEYTEWSGTAGDLADYYPETAEGTLECYRGEEIFWNHGYGVCGPTDGTMVPIEARYLYPIEGNLFDWDKMATLVQAIRDGESPVVRPGYVHLGVVSRDGVKQSEEYDDNPYTSDDIGALTAQVRDGNHRSFAPILAGSDMAWVLMSDSDKQDLEKMRDNPRVNRLYRAIRAAQRAHGVPQFTRRRLKPRRQVPELAVVDQRLAAVQAQMKTLERTLIDRLIPMLQDPAEFTEWMHAHYEWEKDTNMWFRLTVQQLGKERGIDKVVLQILRPDPDRQRLHALDKERLELLSKQRTLRQKAGLDWRTGERAYR